MILGVFLSIGENFADFENKGQDKLIKNYLLKNYSQTFEKVFVFSYANESFKIFKNVFIIPNQFSFHRYLYCVLLPLIHTRYILKCSVLRGLQLTGGIPGLIAKLIFKRKYVFNYGYEYAQVAKIESKPLQAILYKIIQKILLQNAASVIVTAQYLKRKLANEIPVTKLFYIPNGVDANIFKPLYVKKNYSVVFVGRLERQKNVEALLRAIGLLANKYRNILIIGSGSERDKTIKLATKLKIKIHLIQRVSHDELPRFLNQASVFVLPSFIEGQPKVLLEAMSCGMPVIASNIEAHQEIITPGHDGILTETDSHTLSGAIVKVLENSELQKKLSKNARKTILATYEQKRLNLHEAKLLKNL